MTLEELIEKVERRIPTTPIHSYERKQLVAVRSCLEELEQLREWKRSIETLETHIEVIPEGMAMNDAELEKYIEHKVAMKIAMEIVEHNALYKRHKIHNSRNKTLTFKYELKVVMPKGEDCCSQHQLMGGEQ